MKKLVLGLAVTASTLAFAQTTTPMKSSSSDVKFGIKAGMNVSSLSKDSSLDDQKSKIGFNAGIFASIPVAESFSIQPEVLYTQYGSKAVYNDVIDANNSNKVSYTRDLGYVAVPVMFQYKFVPNFYVEAGPEFGFNVTAKDKYDQTLVVAGNTTTTSGTKDIPEDTLNKFNVGIGLGAGYYFTDNIGLTARYVAGVTDVAKDRPNGSDAVRNNTFQVGLAFKF